MVAFVDCLLLALVSVVVGVARGRSMTTNFGFCVRKEGVSGGRSVWVYDNERGVRDGFCAYREVMGG